MRVNYLVFKAQRADYVTGDEMWQFLFMRGHSLVCSVMLYLHKRDLWPARPVTAATDTHPPPNSKLATIFIHPI